MKFIFGLGNPTKKYETSRHNAGFILVDHLANRQNLSFSNEPKFKAEIAKNNEYTFIKPTTFMNNSGECVALVLNYFDKENFKNKNFDNILVIHDDVDLAFGKNKLQRNISSAGHHGIESIQEAIQSLDFWRYRIGMGRPSDSPYDVLNWVLNDLSTQQIQAIQNADLVLDKVFS